MSCAAFYHSGWIELIRAERELDRIDLSSSNYLDDLLSSVLIIRQKIHRIFHLYFTEERSTSSVVAKFCDDYSAKLKLEDRLEFLKKESDHIEKYAELAATKNQLKYSVTLGDTCLLYTSPSPRD